MQNELTVRAYYGLNLAGFETVAIKEAHVLRAFDAEEITADPLVFLADALEALAIKDAEIAALQHIITILRGALEIAQSHAPCPLYANAMAQAVPTCES